MTRHPQYSGKSADQLRWEDYQLGNNKSAATPVSIFGGTGGTRANSSTAAASTSFLPTFAAPILFSCGGFPPLPNCQYSSKSVPLGVATNHNQASRPANCLLIHGATLSQLVP